MIRMKIITDVDNDIKTLQLLYLTLLVATLYID